jgi:uncharacterized protein (TIGR00255 family)
MTGFGQADGENGDCRVAVSVRSVNHRFLDLAIRVADEYRDLEPQLRKILDGRLARGRIDLRVSLEPLGGDEARVSLDEGVVSDLLKAAEKLETMGLAPAALTASDLLRHPDVVQVQRRRGSLGDEGKRLIFDTVGSALDQLVASRENEGAQLAEFLRLRVGELEALVERLAGVREEVRRLLHERLRARLEELMDGPELPPERLAQEAALAAEKADVQEELDRLTAHLANFESGMEGEGALGRRLDFLAQEIHRELNTLGSKCRDARMAEWVIDGKVACEQLREQVQNVE